MKMSDYEHEEIIGRVDNEITIHNEQEEDIVLDEYEELITTESDEKNKPNELDNDVKAKIVRKQSSELWTKFTILNRKHQIAQCNICGSKLSFRSTTSNLRKHMIRKHGIMKSHFTPDKLKFKQKSSATPKLSELDSIILNAVGNVEEDPTLEIMTHDVESGNVQNDVHDYCLVNEEEPASKQEFNSEVTSLSGTITRPSYQTNYTPSTSRRFTNNDQNGERAKRNQILDLQLECLEVKKYIMQMETLLLEQQLNLPRSTYTENLRYCDSITRGTQTDVGGNNTKIFYVMDSLKGSMEGSQHLYSFQAHLQE